MRGYFRQVKSEIRGNPVNHEIKPTVDKRALDKAKRDVESASKKVESARKKEADAVGRLNVAEVKLQELHEKGVTDSGRLAAARERVARDTRTAEAATKDLNRAMADERSSKARVVRLEARFDSAKADGEADSFFNRLVGKAADHGRRVGGALASAVGSALKWGMAGLGTAIVGIAGGAVKLGLDRLMSIDDAKAKLRGLGHEAGAVETIMDSALASVKGTAFGLGEAAGLAASAVAAGIQPGKDLTRYLSLTGDAAAIAGVSLEEMGSVFGKVQTNQRAYTQELNQLADRGIPIYQWLAEEAGVSADAVRDMVSRGEIDSETFLSVIEKNIGGAALSMGDSFRGALANMKAALGRLGAEVLGPFFDQAIGGFGWITGVLDDMTAKAGPWAENMASAVFAVFDVLANGMPDTQVEAILDNAVLVQINEFRDAVLGLVDEYGPRLQDLFFTIGDGLARLGPALGDILLSLGEAAGSAAFSVWEIFLTTLEALAPLIENVIAPAIESLAGFMEDNQGVVNALVGGYVTITSGAWVFDTARKGYDTLRDGIGLVGDTIGKAKGVYGTFVDATYGVAEAQSTLTGKFASAIGAIKGKAAADGTSMIAATKAMTADKLHNAVLKVKSGIIKTVTGVQKGLNAAFRANPIGFVITAILLLVGALVWFFTQTEIGKKLWEKIWEAISTAVEWAWENVIKPVWEGIKTGFEAIGTAIQWVWDNVLSKVFTAIKIYIAIVMTVFLLLWEVVKLVWEGIVWVALWAWENVLKPTWELMKAGLDALGQFFVWVWEALIKPAWDALGAGISWVWENIIRPAWDTLMSVLGAIGSFFQWVWNNVIKPAWDALGAGISWVWENIIRPAWDRLKAALGVVGDFFKWVWNSIIKPAWDALGEGIRWVVDNVVLPVWERMKSALDLVKDAFSSAVDWIGQVWDKIKAITAKPVRFVVETVYNKGIRSAWNKVAGWLDLPKLEEASLGDLGNYNRGGVLPGYSPGRDNYQFIDPKSGTTIGLSGGEAILRPEATRALGTHRVDSINAAARIGGAPAVQKELGLFARGGVVPSIVGLVNRFFPGMSITSTYRNTPDLHGAGQAVDFSNGGNAGTPQMKAAARFFHDNYAPMLAELIHWPLQGWQNIKNGAPLNYGAVTNSQHRNHVHVAARSPLPEPGSPITPISSGGGGGGFTGWMRSRVADAFDAIMGPIGKAIPEFGGGEFGKVPKKMFDKMTDGVRNFLTGKADEMEGSVGVGEYGGNSEFYAKEIIRAAKDRNLGKRGSAIGIATALVESELQMWANPRVPASLGFPHDRVGGDRDSVGLFQQRQAGWGTIAERMNPYGSAALFYNAMMRKFPNWQAMDPGRVAQGVQVSAYPARYGQRMGQAQGWVNRLYDDGGVATGRGFLLKNVVDPERVLSPRQTVSFERFVGALDRFERRPSGMSAHDINGLQFAGGGTGGEYVAQKIENQYVVDPAANRREVRRASKRVLAERGLR